MGTLYKCRSRNRSCLKTSDDINTSMGHANHMCSHTLSYARTDMTSPFQCLCPECGLQIHFNTFICEPSRMAPDFCSNRTALNRTYAGRHFKEAFVNPHPKFQGDCFLLYFGLKSRKLDIVQGAWLKSNRPLWQRLERSNVGKDCNSSFRSFSPRSD